LRDSESAQDFGKARVSLEEVREALLFQIRTRPRDPAARYLEKTHAWQLTADVVASATFAVRRTGFVKPIT